MNKHVRQLTSIEVAAEYAVEFGFTLSNADQAFCLILQRRMESDPRYLNEAVTDECAWDAEEHDAEDIGSLAANKLWAALEKAKASGAKLNSYRVLRLVAAVTASYSVASDQRDARRDFERAWDERGEINYGRLYT